MQYLALVELYKQLESTTKRLQKTNSISQFLSKIEDKDLRETMLLIQGRAFPVWDSRTIGIADKILAKAIVLSTGLTQEKVEQMWKETGDLGDAAAKCIAAKKQATLFFQPLTVLKVFENLQKTALMEGDGTVDRKIQLISELLTSANSDEARYIVRIFLEDLRIGVGEGSIRDSIVWSCFGREIGITYLEQENDIALDDEQRKKYDTYSTIVQEAYDLTHDFAQVLMLARKGIAALQTINLEPGKPFKVMLYQKVASVSQAFEAVGRPCAFEYKYDGFRLQIHKQNKKITLFTRRLEDVTKQFPDVVELVVANIKCESFIIDAEAVGIDMICGKYIAFQNISQRIKRKYDIQETAKKFPVELNAFDLLYCDGKSLIQEPFFKRREILKSIISQKEKQILLAGQQIINEEKIAEEFYKKSLSLGFEGVMVKNLNGIYKPGSRVGYGVKLKPVMETLDVVIVSAEWGEGKRSQWLSSFTVAIRDENENMLEIGKVGTGIKEKEEGGVSFSQLTEALKPFITKTDGMNVFFKPAIVIEVAYEEIQASTTYNSGYALRFPRFVRLREDRSAQNISEKKDVEQLYQKQRGRDAL